MRWRRGARRGEPSRHLRGRRRTGAATGVVALLTGLLLALTGCSSAADDGPAEPASHEYRPGLQAFPYVPANAKAAPVVVMVPGGAWRSADPAGFHPLAAALADSGVVAVPVRIRAAEDDVVYPVPLDDVMCALADGVATAREAGVEPTRVVLLGHSSGAHLAALATLAPEQLTPDCDDPLVTADAFVGLAGPYDIRSFREPASALFRPDATAAEWDAANPLLLAAQKPDVPVLLLHGGDDEAVPVSFSNDFAAALTAAGHPTTLTVLPGEDHDSIYAAEVAAPRIAEWLRALPQD